MSPELSSRTDDLTAVIIPQSYNYIGVFLTLECNLKCSYCINRFAELHKPAATLSAEQWLQGLNRLVCRSDLPITLQGGEPSLHYDFYRIINGLNENTPIDFLTNLHLDIDSFMRNILPDRLKRDAPYASIRVSYHPEIASRAKLKEKILKMLRNNYSVGVWAVDHPEWQHDIARTKDEFQRAGIDFRIKEFLGIYNGKLYGSYKYLDAIHSPHCRAVQCRTSELLIGPDGNIYRCHSDLYHARAPIGHICDPDLQIGETYLPCNHYGSCNPCDIKIKTNRFQEYGHTSVDIKFVDCTEQQPLNSAKIR